MTRDVKWADWKKTHPVETLKMFHKAQKEDLVSVIGEDVILKSKPEKKVPVHVICDEVERVRPNELSEKSSQLTNLNKDTEAHTSAYDRVLNSLKKLDTLYNPTMQKIHNAVIEGKYKVTGDTRFIPVVQPKDDEIKWSFSTSISTDAGEPETFKESMTSTSGDV